MNFDEYKLDELKELTCSFKLEHKKSITKKDIIELLNHSELNYENLKVDQLKRLCEINNYKITGKKKTDFINVINYNMEYTKDQYNSMTINNLKEMMDYKNIGYKKSMVKNDLIELLLADDVPTENKDEVVDVNKIEENKINMDFDAAEEKIVIKVSTELIDQARNNSNMIDDMTVDVKLMTEIGSNYNKRIFAKVQKRLEQSNVDINFTSHELEETIAQYSAITDDVNEEEINYAIDTLLRGMDTKNNSDEVKNFLQSINEYPLLTKDKEQELGKIIIEAHRKLEKGEELEFFEREDYESARELLSLSNKRLVVSQAKRYINRGMDLIDLVMEGMLGLEKAISKFDYEQGFKFSTYATWWVRQGITRAIADKSKVIRIPVHMVETINKVTKVQRELTQQLGLEPTYEQIGKACNPVMTVEEVEHIFNIARDPIALEMPIGEDNSSLEAFIEDDKNLSQVEEAEKTELNQKLLEIIEEIPEREGEVLQYRYGLYNLDTSILTLKLEELEEIHEKVINEEIQNLEIETMLIESEKISTRVKTKYAKRIAQNNEKYTKNMEEITNSIDKTDKKSLLRVEKCEKDLERITETNIKYLERLIDMTKEQIDIIQKIDILTEGVVKPLTLEEVGQLYEVTRERIRQIETKGKRKLKAIVDKERMDLFLHDV